MDEKAQGYSMQNFGALQAPSASNSLPGCVQAYPGERAKNKLQGR